MLDTLYYLHDLCVYTHTPHTHHTHTPHTHTTHTTHTQNAFQVPSSLAPVHLMSLEALYAVMTTIQSGHTPTPFSEAQPTSQSLPPYQDDHAPIVHASSPSLYKGEGPDGHVVVEVREGAGPPPLKVLQAICQKKKVLLPWCCHGVL